jgi:hypothetical protein
MKYMLIDVARFVFPENGSSFLLTYVPEIAGIGSERCGISTSSETELRC